MAKGKTAAIEMGDELALLVSVVWIDEHEYGKHGHVCAEQRPALHDPPGSDIGGGPGVRLRK
jgi:hypothetical protein